ncbi:MAG: polysaccharide biosynthesis/export family protein [Planctomycetia bacterium]|nr:polysaccharide biosynthesis/export family protein [Planctomycetia bacterium]MCC7313203.1 polysaccharide biosynthesis/export family protein [Planctomycetota bacterium]OQY98320.1 MAG: hypothetical protein B6D36_17710 [Planctomycetes bacterium UTPLA1]
MTRVIRYALVCSAPAWLLLSQGCSRTNDHIPDVAPIEKQELYQPFVGGTGLPEQLLDRPPYRLMPSDVLEIIYQVRNMVTDKPYDLKIEDVIRIKFPYQDRFNQKLTVQGDGNIRCLMLGPVRAAGRTAGDLEEQLRRAYARYIKHPEMTVVVEAANVKISELKKAITTAPRGQSRLVPVKPDGTIDLPFVGECLVAGKTVHETKKMLDARYYEEDLPEIEVTVQTLEFAPRRIYVMGEVLAPGLIEMNAPITLAQAIIRQGGPNPRADRSKILLVRRQYLPVPEALVFNLEELLHSRKPTEFGSSPKGSDWRYDCYLADGDIIWVPPTTLAVANDWIDQFFTRGIRSVFPYSGVVGMNFGYSIYEPPNTVKTRAIGPPGINAQVGP